MSEIKKLRKKRYRVWRKAKKLADRAADRGGDYMNSRERARWESLITKLNIYDIRISALDQEQQ